MELKTEPIYKYKIKLDIKKDASNWFDGCNHISFGLDWKKRAPAEIVKNIYGKSKTEAYEFLIPFLKQKYIDEKEKIKQARKRLKNVYEQKFDLACEKMVELMGKPIYRNDFTIYLTTFPRGPYNYYYGTIWEYIGWDNPIMGFLHELAHFQLWHYWYKNPDSPVSKLPFEHYDYLKESLTMILDKDLLPLIERPDMGYEIHKEFRKLLTKQWETNKDFDKLVEFGLKKLPEFVK